MTQPLIEITYDVWINPNYIVSVQIDGMPDFPVLITMDAPDGNGDALTYRINLVTWQHVRNWLKLYTRLPKQLPTGTDSSEA